MNTETEQLLEFFDTETRELLDKDINTSFIHVLSYDASQHTVKTAIRFVHSIEKD
jgi:hypothetical protein